MEGLGRIDWLSPWSGAHQQTNHWDNRDRLQSIGSDLLVPMWKVESSPAGKMVLGALTQLTASCLPLLVPSCPLPTGDLAPPALTPTDGGRVTLVSGGPSGSLGQLGEGLWW